MTICIILIQRLKTNENQIIENQIMLKYKETFLMHTSSWGAGFMYSKRAVIPEVVARRGVCSKLVLVYVEFMVDV